MFNMRVESVKLVLFLTAIVICECKVSSIEKAYHKGLTAYSGERWSECITQFEESLHLYKLYKSIIVNCRLKCNSEPYETLVQTDVGDLKIYEKFFVARNCLNDCQDKSFRGSPVDNDVDDKTLFNMHARKPFNYLHVCYFQVNALPKAASAAYTYLIVNPDDETMLNNLYYYVDQPEVDIDEVEDFLSENYKVLYNLGRKSYEAGKWAETVANMEEVVTDYISTENICRAECERQPDQQISPEFVITVSNNIASLLHCHQHCQKGLNILKYNSGVEFFADVLNYLQISYYNLNRLDDAAKAVATYLTLMPSDVDMLANKQIYSTLIDDKSFTDRSDIVYYFSRDNYEKKLLNFFHQGDNFNIESNTV